MSIGINIHQSLRHLTDGKATVEVDGNTVGRCLDNLVQQFPGIKAKLFDEKGKLFNYVDIYVSLKSSYPEELAMPVKDGDKLSITLIIARG
jgi:molybdopterin converting factor small subunit